MHTTSTEERNKAAPIDVGAIRYCPYCSSAALSKVERHGDQYLIVDSRVEQAHEIYCHCCFRVFVIHSTGIPK